MTSNERFELKARAFNILFGVVAPGKDVPAARGSDDYEARQRLWIDWLSHNGKTIDAMLTAFDEWLEWQKDTREGE